MAGLPNVKIDKKNGALGGIVPSNDGESLLVITVPASIITAAGGNAFAFADVLAFRTKFATANESATSPLRFESHVESYFSVSSSKLHVILIDQASSGYDVILVSSDPAYTTVFNYLKAQNGKIKLVAYAQNFVSVVSAFGATGVTADLGLGVPLAQALATLEFTNGRPIHVLLEGKAVSPTAGSFTDLRSKNAPNVSVVAWQNKTKATYLVSSTPTNTMGAEIGYTLGLLSALPVMRNIGRVANGKIIYPDNIAFSNGTLVETIAKATLDSAADKGYIFATRHPQTEGYYLSDDPTCTLITDDFAWITRNRTINKAAAITRRVYTQRILDEVYTDPDTGKLSALTIKNFESEVEQAIRDEMVRLGECTAVDALVSPDQDVITTGEIVIELRIVPVGHARYITAKIGFAKTI